MKPKNRHLLPSIGHPVPVRSGAGGNQLLSKFIPSTLSSTLAAFTSSAFAAFIFLFSLTLLSAGCNRDDEHSGKYSAKGGEITFIATGGNPSASTKSSADVLSSGASLSAGTHSLSASGGNSIEGEKTYKIYYDFDKGENVEAPAFGSSRDADGNLIQSSDTRFSGEVFTVGTSDIERIDWLVNDKLTLFECTSNQYGGYIITSVTSSNDERSRASLVPIPPSKGLQWSIGSDNKFIGVYPCIDDFPGVGYSIMMKGTTPFQVNFLKWHKPMPSQQYCKLVEGVRTGERWYEPEMKYARLLASKVVPSSEVGNGALSLEFYPQFSSVEVKLFKPSGISGTVKLKSAKLKGGTGSGATITGSPQMSVEAGTTIFRQTNIVFDNYAGTDPVYGNEITLSFKDSDGTTDVDPILEEYGASGSKPVSFTFLFLPNTVEQLALELTLEVDGTTQTKTLRLLDGDGWIRLYGGWKMTITNMKTWDFGYNFQVPDQIDIYANGPYEVDSPPITLTSYYVNGATKTAQNITAEYSIDGTEWYTYNNVPAGSALAEIINSSSGLDAFQLNTATDGVYKDSYLHIMGNPATPEAGDVNRASRATSLRSKSSINSIATIMSTCKRQLGGLDYVDLSYYNTWNGQHNVDPVHAAIGPETANSYVIRHKGRYCLPLVYGNALDCVLVPESPHYNTQAYNPTAAASSYTYLRPFQNGAGAGITSPYILEDRGISDITSVNATILWQDVAEADGFLTINGITAHNISGTMVPYIHFTIGDNIQEGNVVIALRNSSNEILWSWHIWVTTEPLDSKTVTNHDGVETKLLPVPLGWNREATEIYPERRFYVRFTQQTSGQQKVAEVIQHKGTFIIGNAPFYQWGRKDPFLPGNGRTVENKNYSSPGGYSIVSSSSTIPVLNSSADKLSASIRNPHTMYAYYINTTQNYIGWIGNRATPFNLWDANQASIPEQGYGAYYLPTGPYVYRATKPVKTIYDPCPPGFSVPRDDFASGFITNGESAGSYNTMGLGEKSQQNVVWNKDSRGGLLVKCSSSDTDGFFMPRIGSRYPGAYGASATPGTLTTPVNISTWASALHLSFYSQNTTNVVGSMVELNHSHTSIVANDTRNTSMGYVVFPSY